MSASTSTSSIAVTELPELVTVTFEHCPKRYPDEECVEWDNLTMDRRPNSWGLYEFNPWGIPSYSSQQRFEEYGRHDNPAEAWARMLKHYDHFNSLIFVGPGESPAVLASPKFEPECWTVYRVDDQGQCIETGRFVHRLSVLSAVKSIIADGGCPVAVSPYLAPDFEWDVDRVVMSSEQENPTDRFKSLDHLLTIAKRGKSRGGSGGEQRARRIVQRLLDDLVGLDDSAAKGITELVSLLHSRPSQGAEAVRKAIK